LAFGERQKARIVYNKLVRDKIPGIIEDQGQTPQIRTLSDEEYLLHLEQKLDEEVGEYHKDKTPEELADILEVVYALAATAGCSKRQLMDLYQQKHDARGGFEKRYFLISKTEDGEV
jgi:predicted house-cleaning noncanonical NTP pyrophosphatase (MazG superfamily)